MPELKHMKKDELAHLIAMHRSAQTKALFGYDQHYSALMRLKKDQLVTIASELEMPTVNTRNRE